MYALQPPPTWPRLGSEEVENRAEGKSEKQIGGHAPALIRSHILPPSSQIAWILVEPLLKRFDGHLVSDPLASIHQLWFDVWFRGESMSALSPMHSSSMERRAHGRIVGEPELFHLAES